MDQIVSRTMMIGRGAAGFDRGLAVDEHDMNPTAPATADWQAGWRWRQEEVAQGKDGFSCFLGLIYGATAP